ncbi:MAG: glycosyltransferase family 2 protein [Candidatus Xenobia bacterium]
MPDQPQVALLDVLIPTRCRPAALGVTLSMLAHASFTQFRVIVSDQSEGCRSAESPEVEAVLRLFRARGHAVTVHRHVPGRGLAEQRDFLLSCAAAPYVLFLDDDVMLEPWVPGALVRILHQEQCGFVGCAPIGLSYLHDVRPDEQGIEFWKGPVHPETPHWNGRSKLHRAANLYHVQRRLGLNPEKLQLYKVDRLAGCVAYNTRMLQQAGGFSFWQELPPDHHGEHDVVQYALMAEAGGCGIIPSGAYHMEVAAALVDRGIYAPDLLLPKMAPSSYGTGATNCS